LVPGGGVRFAAVVLEVHVLAGGQIDLPHVLAQGVAPDAAAGAVADVIEDLVADDQRAGVFVFAPRHLFDPRDVFDRAFFAQELVDLDAAQRFGSEGGDAREVGVVAVGVDRAFPRGEGVVDEVGVVRRDQRRIGFGGGR